MARILLVGGEQRAMALAGRLLQAEHAVRVVVATAERRLEVERLGAQAVVGDPDRLASLSGALEHVTVACWLMAGAGGARETAAALHGARLERFLASAVDSTVRGFVYEAGGTAVASSRLQEGEQIAMEKAAKSQIPVAVLRRDPADQEGWLEEATEAIEGLLGA